MGLKVHLFALTLFMAFIILPGLLVMNAVPSAWLGDLSEPLRLLALEYTAPVYGVVHVPSALFIGASGILMLMSPTPTMERPQKKVIRRATAELKLLISGQTGGNVYQAAWAAALREPYVRDVIEGFLVSGSASYLKTIVEDRLRTARTRLQNTSGHLAHIAGALPMFGMLGTIAGLMFMFGDTGGPDVAGNEINQKFAGMATALLTTLYATGATAFFIKPWYQSVEARIEEFDHDRDEFLSVAGKAMRSMDTGRLRAARPVELS